MKRILFLLACSLLVAAGVWADDGVAKTDNNVFNHLSVGANVGTNGVGLDLAVPATNFMALRVGYNWFPKIKYKTSLNLINYPTTGGYTFPNEFMVQGQPNNNTAHALVDVYPFGENGFHITLGAYFGKQSIVDVHNVNNGELIDVYAYNKRTTGQRCGLALGNYLLEPDANGNVYADLRVNKLRPYLGLGFGRAVPKNRVNCQVDLGVQFLGKSEVWVRGDAGDYKVTQSDLNEDSGKLLKKLTKLNVYPVVNVRIVGRIF
ncbi:MAG: hypothetical protein IJT30_10000 [Muribaculaceae bacterium]|nr:hypothetical protein [Muribaculaceae bacterium]